jgi:hypothetical protein
MALPDQFDKDNFIGCETSGGGFAMKATKARQGRNGTCGKQTFRRQPDSISDRRTLSDHFDKDIFIGFLVIPIHAF